MVESVLCAYGLEDGSPIDEEGLVRITVDVLRRTGWSNDLIKAMGWRLYESLTSRVLSFHGLSSLHDVTVVHKGTRSQVDVIGVGSDRLYVIECKRWRRSIYRGQMKNLGEAARRRAVLIAELLRERIGPGSKVVHVVPVVLTVYGGPEVIEEAFRVPIQSLPAFIAEHPMALPSPPLIRVELGEKLNGELMTKIVKRVARTFGEGVLERTS